MSDITIYGARKIITMDPNRPEATHVAVKDRRILAVGGADCADLWGGGRHDDTFADAVLVPGFCEGHAHLMAGAMWDFPYVGYYEVKGPDGRIWPALKTVDDVIAALKKAEQDMEPGTPLFAWGFDPIFLDGERLHCRHLDAVSKDRPIVVYHSNGHLLTTNSHGLTMVGYTRNTNVEGVARFDDGEPNGELQELAAMFPLMRRFKLDFRSLAKSEKALRNYAAVANLVGVTTSADLANDLEDEDVARLLRVTSGDDYPLRLIPALNGIQSKGEEVVTKMPGLVRQSTDKLTFGMVKLMNDGSIQGYTSRMKWPGHINGRENGIWNTTPEQLADQVEKIHAAGIQINIHTNGDEASEAAINAIEAALQKHPRGDHRHTLQHGQMITEALFRRMRNLGIGVNLFANHLWYFGDQHYEVTQGPDRACRMDACRSALANGVPLTIHSDAPVTPLNPLFTMWCAVNRVTPKGRVLGEYQRITPMEALHAITLGGAYAMKRDAEVGSIECGKLADFAVLGDDPLSVDPMAIRDIPVHGTVVGGVVHLT
jgi:predicted amidohydrolase YtcJ